MTAPTTSGRSGSWCGGAEGFGELYDRYVDVVIRYLHHRGASTEGSDELGPRPATCPPAPPATAGPGATVSPLETASADWRRRT